MRAGANRPQGTEDAGPAARAARGTREGRTRRAAPRSGGMCGAGQGPTRAAPRGTRGDRAGGRGRRHKLPTPRGRSRGRGGHPPPLSTAAAHSGTRGAAAAEGRVGWPRSPLVTSTMFHVKPRRNYQYVSNLQNGHGRCKLGVNIPKLPQQYLAGAGLTRCY